ncbi:MAG TPA: PIG-L family deacetylase [Candidatus Saccharimonadales bacterium]|nr:PIG-L family deacetylase [Candidatus Saccharimonadales bacterium]
MVAIDIITIRKAHFVQMFTYFIALIFFAAFANTAFATTCTSGTTLNVVAHPDDDILFLNPDINHEIANGKCLITAYTTAGDGNLGQQYWSTRMQGVEAAYAQMSGVSNSWSDSYITINGHSVSVSTLNNNSKISLVFFKLPDGQSDGSGFSNNNYESLQKLWLGQINSLHSVDGSTSYTKQDLINSITSLMNTYHPDEINTQNYKDAYDYNADHSDHYSTAYFTNEAHKLYTTAHVFTGYYGYQTASFNSNVSGNDLTKKQDAFFAYTPYDLQVCQTLSSCDPNRYGAWFSRQYIVDSVSTASTGLELLIDGAWSLSGNNGSSEYDIGIPSTSLVGMYSVQVTLNLHGTTFGNGDDEASIIFIQSGQWIGANLTSYVRNGYNGTQTVTIPLSAFHKIGDSTIRLDTTKPVSDLHARFWNRSIFTVDISSVQLFGSTTVLSVNASVPTPTPTPTPSSTPTPTPIVTPTASAINGVELLSPAWTLTANNGSDEKNQGLSPNILTGMVNVQVTFNLHGTRFGSGDDEAAVVFVQNNTWMAANLTGYGQNSLNASQTITIPLSDFHKVGSSSTKLDVTKPVTDLHARFWNSGTFTVDLTSVKLTSSGNISPTATPTPTPIATPSVTPSVTPSTSPTPTPTPSPTPSPNSGSNILSNSWSLSGRNGSDEGDIEIASNSLSGKTSVKVTLNLNGVSFGDGDDEASIILIQNGVWMVANITDYANNGQNGEQTFTIPLTDFHKIGSSTKLDLTKPVSNLHARFWNSGTFSVNISNIKFQ